MSFTGSSTVCLHGRETLFFRIDFVSVFRTGGRSKDTLRDIGLSFLDFLEKLNQGIVYYII